MRRGVAIFAKAGWALDRIDEPGTTYVDDGTYEYTNDGSGRTIYILDSGLNLDIQAVAVTSFIASRNNNDYTSIMGFFNRIF
jgi:hypothetical protein